MVDRKSSYFFWGRNCFAMFCVFHLDSGANFLERNLKVSFRHLESSTTLLCVTLGECCACADLHRWTNRRFHRRFAYFGRFFLLITYTYMSCTHPSCNLKTWLDWTRQAAVDTKHCMRSAPGQSAYNVSRCGLDLTVCRRWRSWRFIFLFRLRLGFKLVSSFLGRLAKIHTVCEIGCHILDKWSTDQNEDRIS
jgi:hypothetical protein